jgi:hypothetical protein
MNNGLAALAAPAKSWRDACPAIVVGSGIPGANREWWILRKPAGCSVTPGLETMVAIWSPARIAEALRSDALGERDKLHLLVASFVSANLFGSLGILYMWRMPTVLVTSFLGLAIIIGLYAAFRANQRGDGVRFVADPKPMRFARCWRHDSRSRSRTASRRSSEAAYPVRWRAAEQSLGF